MTTEKEREKAARYRAAHRDEINAKKRATYAAIKAGEYTPKQYKKREPLTFEEKEQRRLKNLDKRAAKYKEQHKNDELTEKGKIHRAFFEKHSREELAKIKARNKAAKDMAQERKKQPKQRAYTPREYNKKDPKDTESNKTANTTYRSKRLAELKAYEQRRTELEAYLQEWGYADEQYRELCTVIQKIMSIEYDLAEGNSQKINRLNYKYYGRKTV